MDRERLKQIIIEEVLRAIGELPWQGVPRALADAPNSPVLSPSFAGSPAKAGVVIFSGSRPPTEGVLEAITGLSAHGYTLRVLPSFSFRQAQNSKLPQALKGVPVISNPDDEPAMERLIASSQWIVSADTSLNTLNKIHLGIEDSAPSRAISHAIRRGLGLVFLESGTAPLRGPESKRAELIRKFEALGGLRASPDELPAALFRATIPPDDKLFKPPMPKPEVRHRIITRDDVYEAATRGITEFVVPGGAIVTAEAIEDATRRGMTIRREEI